MVRLGGFDEEEESMEDDLNKADTLDSNLNAITTVLYNDCMDNRTDYPSQSENHSSSISFDQNGSEIDPGEGDFYTNEWNNGIRHRNRRSYDNGSGEHEGNFYNSGNINYRRTHDINDHNIYHANGRESRVRFPQEHIRHPHYNDIYANPEIDAMRYPYETPYEYQQQNKSPPTWKRNLVVILVFFFFYRHYEALSLPIHTVSLFTSQLCIQVYTLAKEDISIIIQQIRSSYNDAMTTTLNINNLPQEQCILQIPTNLTDALSAFLLPEFDSYDEHSSASEIWLLNGIVGQNKQIKRISQALDGWILNDHDSFPSQHQKNSETVSSVTKKNERDKIDLTDSDLISTPTKMFKNSPVRPLALLLTGPDGVGKSESAHLISQLLFSHCRSPLYASTISENSVKSQFRKHKSILVIHSEDYITKSTKPEDSSFSPKSYTPREKIDALNQYHEAIPFPSNTETARERLQNKIVEHIHSNSHDTLGAVIIFTGIEKIDDASTLDVFSDILSLPPGTIYSIDHGELSHVKVSFDRALFIFTTDLGTDQIFHLIQEYEGNTNLIPKIKANKAVRNAFDRHWDSGLKLSKVRFNQRFCLTS